MTGEATAASYAQRSQALDAAIAAVIADWSAGETFDDASFDDLALQIFAYQLRYNRPYARYCETLGFSHRRLPQSWRAIPPVPAPAFKETVLATFDPSAAALAFATSGTTASRRGRHYLETSALYEAASAAAFARYMLPDRAQLRYLNLVPYPPAQPHSSLGYMMQHVAAQFGRGQTGWYLRDDELDYAGLETALLQCVAFNQPVCLAATAFALVAVLDWLQSRPTAFALPPGSRIMETGGFKGRSRTVERSELYALLQTHLGVPPSAIVAEYGMTELSSQYYDDVLLAQPPGPLVARRKVGPPWLRTRVVGPDGLDVPDETVGALVHVDLANRSSCIAVATEDLGVRFSSPTGPYFVLIGRDAAAPLRGCSLDAETLLTR